MDLSKYLRKDFRRYIVPLVKKNKCEVCGSKTNLEIHHLYSFTIMLNDTLKELKLEYKDTDKYNDIELLNIREKMLGKHLRYKYQTLCKDCHIEETNTQLQSDRFRFRYCIFGFNRDGSIDENLVQVIKELYNIYNQYNTKECIKFIGKYTDCYKSVRSILNYMSNKKMIDIVGEDIYNNFIQVKDNRKCSENKNAFTNRSNCKYESLIYHCCNDKMKMSKQNGSTYFRCYNKCIGNRKNFKADILENNLDIEIIKNMDNALSETYKNSSTEEQKNILRQIIDRIIIYSYDNFEIIYK